MRVGKIGVVIIGLVPFNVYAECTPTPDCADMGYTQTSCEGKFVRCPFDTSKLFCAPCDSKFQYTCSGDNITGGIGSTCGGKYVSCECDANLGYYFDNGICTCSDITPTSCSVGAIYYADGTCSNDYIACQNPVGVVVKDNSLIVSLDIPIQLWSPQYVDVSTLVNTSSLSSAQSDYNGVSNTSALVSYYGEDTDVNSCAAIYCYTYAPDGLESSKNKWYLPAAGEWYRYMYVNYASIKNAWDKAGTTISQIWFWSSSEVNDTYSWFVNSEQGNIEWGGKADGRLSVSCFLSISD